MINDIDNIRYMLYILVKLHDKNIKVDHNFLSHKHMIYLLRRILLEACHRIQVLQVLHSCANSDF